MKTVGEILKSARLQKKISLEEVEKETKIRKKFLRALEENDLETLPTFPFSRGFLKNYSQYLGLPSEEIIAIFKRQTKEEEITLLPKKINGGFQFRLTPKIAGIFLAIFLFSLFIFYLTIQFLTLLGKPSLKIYYPKRNISVKKEILEIKGKTDPQVKVFINSEEILPEENGNFLESITLNKGENKIIIISKNKKGKESKKEIIVNYK